jgi:glutaredoxin
MAIKLHRCRNIWVKTGGHPCWRVQKALDEAGVNYEIVKEKYWGPREETVSRTGRRHFPWIEFEDGSVYREESKDMAERIRSGKLDEASRQQMEAQA